MPLPPLWSKSWNLCQLRADWKRLIILACASVMRYESEHFKFSLKLLRDPNKRASKNIGALKTAAICRPTVNTFSKKIGSESCLISVYKKSTTFINCELGTGT